jgi:thiosulfate dehydrogenase (quinone) large subunit
MAAVRATRRNLVVVRTPFPCLRGASFIGGLDVGRAVAGSRASQVIRTTGLLPLTVMVTPRWANSAVPSGASPHEEAIAMSIDHSNDPAAPTTSSEPPRPDIEVVERPDDAAPAHAASPRTSPLTGVAAPVMALLRVALGWVFLWAFLDKTFGLGYGTPSGDAAWINGGSPTEGFLSAVTVGPFEDQFQDLAGQGWADWLFMIGLLGVGVALILGIGLRAAAVAGTVMMAFMWAAEWPPDKTSSTGDPVISSNPVVDDHVIYALVLIVLALTYAGDHLGLGRWWARLGIVRRTRGLLR